MELTYLHFLPVTALDRDLDLLSEVAAGVATERSAPEAEVAVEAANTATSEPSTAEVTARVRTGRNRLPTAGLAAGNYAKIFNIRRVLS